MNGPTGSDLIDVRSLPPVLRHYTIFQHIDGLPAGRSFVLVNDHDPRPLRHQLEAGYPGQFSWTYLESGPTVWQVKIAKLAEAAGPQA